MAVGDIVLSVACDHDPIRGLVRAVVGGCPRSPSLYCQLQPNPEIKGWRLLHTTEVRNALHTWTPSLPLLDTSSVCAWAKAIAHTDPFQILRRRVELHGMHQTARLCVYACVVWHSHAQQERTCVYDTEGRKTWQKGAIGSRALLFRRLCRHCRRHSRVCTLPSLAGWR